MKEILFKLLTVKSIVTILLTITFCVLCFTGVIGAGAFVNIFTVIIAFYFGTQAQKIADSKNQLK